MPQAVPWQGGVLYDGQKAVDKYNKATRNWIDGIVQGNLVSVSIFFSK